MIFQFITLVPPLPNALREKRQRNTRMSRIAEAAAAAATERVTDTTVRGFKSARRLITILKETVIVRNGRASTCARSYRRYRIQCQRFRVSCSSAFDVSSRSLVFSIRGAPRMCIMHACIYTRERTAAVGRRNAAEAGGGEIHYITLRHYFVYSLSRARAHLFTECTTLPARAPLDSRFHVGALMTRLDLPLSLSRCVAPSCPLAVLCSRGREEERTGRAYTRAREKEREVLPPSISSASTNSYNDRLRAYSNPSII